MCGEFLAMGEDTGRMGRFQGEPARPGGADPGAGWGSGGYAEGRSAWK